MRVAKVLCLYPCGVLVALVAVLFGFCANAEIPEGRAFATLIPLVGGGLLPATIVGEAWREKFTRVAKVPSWLAPMKRPAAELLLPMLGGDPPMPALGLGLCCRPTAYDVASVSRSVLWFLLQGGRHLDTAQLYLNHVGVGKGIREAIARGVPRSEMFIVTKLVPRFFSGDEPDRQVPRWLKELGVDYVDLVLLHHPEGFGPIGRCSNGTAAECRANAWRRLSKLREAGLIRHLGVSNHGIAQIEALRALELAPVSVNQIQYNPWAPDWQQEVVDFCQSVGIVVTAWAPFQGTMMQHAQVFTVQTLNEIATANGKSVAQVLLRWALQKKVSAIPGSSDPQHMADNLAVHTFTLSAEEMAKIDAVRSDPKAKDFFAMGFDRNMS